MFDSKRSKKKKKKEKSQFGAPVPCRTFSFDPPLLSATPSQPPTPPTTHIAPRLPQTLTQTDMRGFSRPAGSHASEPFLPSPLSQRLANIYLPCMVCICPNCCNRQTLREERRKWGERVTGRQRGRNREGESESNRRGEGGELYMLVTCI